MRWNLNQQYHTRRQIVNTFERIPKGWEQYYSLPDFQKRWRRVKVYTTKE